MKTFLQVAKSEAGSSQTDSDHYLRPASPKPSLHFSTINLEDLKRPTTFQHAKVQSDKSSESSGEKEDSESRFSSTNDLLEIGCKSLSNHGSDLIYPSAKSPRKERPCDGSLEHIPGSSDHLPLADLTRSTHAPCGIPGKRYLFKVRKGGLNYFICLKCLK